MSQYSSYPVASEINAADLILFHVYSLGVEKLITYADLIASLANADLPVTFVNSNTVLTGVEQVVVAQSATPINVSLADTATRTGKPLYLSNQGDGLATFTAAGADMIYDGTASVTSISIAKFKGKILVSDGVGTWQVMGGDGGTPYELPVATASVLGGVKQGTGITIAGDGTISVSGSGSGDVIGPASSVANQIAVFLDTTGKEIYGLDLVTGSLYGRATGGSYGSILVGDGLQMLSGTLQATVFSVAGKTGPVTLAKADVGLANVDDTSDSTKWAAVAVLTNKTISGATNTLSNIAVGSIVMSTGFLLGRSTASTGAVEQITVGSGLSLTGGVLTATGGGGGGGDVTGPGSSTAGGLVAFNGTTGKIIQAASTVTVAQGGTGLTSFTQGALVVATGTTTLASLANGASSGYVLTAGSGGTSGPAWSNTPYFGVSAAIGTLTNTITNSSGTMVLTSGTGGINLIAASGSFVVATVSGGGLFRVNGGNLQIQNPSVPGSASASGVSGTITWDTNYLYVCTATNTWKRTPLTTW